MVLSLREVNFLEEDRLKYASYSLETRDPSRVRMQIVLGGAFHASFF